MTLGSGLNFTDVDSTGCESPWWEYARLRKTHRTPPVHRSTMFLGEWCWLWHTSTSRAHLDCIASQENPPTGLLGVCIMCKTLDRPYSAKLDLGNWPRYPRHVVFLLQLNRINCNSYVESEIADRAWRQKANTSMVSVYRIWNRTLTVHFIRRQIINWIPGVGIFRT